MATIFVLAGSFLGFWLAMVGLILGSGLAVAILLWTGAGVISALLYVALTTIKPGAVGDELTQSA